VPALSVAIITKNEAARIERCVESVSWADEIVVVDSGSIDDTVELCRRAGCRVIESEWLGFGRTKQLAVDSCSNDLVLVLDADETVSDELRVRLLRVRNAPERAGYRIRRVSYYLGQRIKHCGWGRDEPLRLFDRRKGRFNEKAVHESIEMSDGLIGTIREPLLHDTYPDIETHIRKMTRYAHLSAEEQAQRRSASIASACGRGLWKFITMYIFKLGFLDGRNGFVLCLNSAFGAYLRESFIREIRHGKA